MAFLQNHGRYVVLGLGGSGLSAVQYLHGLGFDVAICDQNQRPNLVDQLPQGVQAFFGDFDEALLLAATGIVISPGIDPLNPAILAARTAGVAIVSDVQLFIDECHARSIEIVAITGSNAKSTVTTLLGQMAKDAGRLVGVGGNIGTPALALLNQPLQLAVLELSSFQLEGISDLGASVATILNISPDHLDRHKTMDAYLQAKLRIFAQAKSAVLNDDDPLLMQACLQQAQATQVVIVSQHAPKTGAFGLVQHHGALWLAYGDTLLIASDELKIKGVHNLTNALFALALGRQIGLSFADMLKTLVDFGGLAHRCQFVRQIGTSSYFNDSKGTNVGATLAAIEGLGAVYGNNALVLIVGGQAKGQDFSQMVDLINRYVHTVLTIGEDADKIADDLTQAGSYPALIACQTLEVAVTVASTKAAPCVLLSPACASFDQFTSFAHRGDVFMQLVHNLHSSCD